MAQSFPGPAYLVCCDARTGSSLLAATLRGTGRAGKPFEYFSRAEVDKPWLRGELRVPDGVPFTSFRDWRDYIVNAGSEMGGVFAASVHFFQFGDCVATFGDAGTPSLDALRGYFPQLRLVWLRRDNIVAQAISHYVAIATNVWNSRQGGSAEADEAPYDFAKIDWQVHSIHVAQQGWRDALKGAEAITLPLTYEELAADLPGAVRRLFAHVGISADGAPVRASGLEKQANAWSMEMERRYRQERAARGMGPVGDEAALKR